jgi:hypothetical protein
MYNVGVIVVYSIGSDGSLTRVDSDPGLGRVYSMVVDPTGRFLYALNVGATGTATIGSFSIGSNGALARIGSPVDAGNSYGLFAMDPIGGIIFRPNTATYFPLQWDILGFGISSTGSLTPIGATPKSVDFSDNIAVDPHGRFVFSVNSALSAGGGGSVYRIQPYDIGFEGGLTPIAAPVGVAGAGALAPDPTGRFLYQLQGNDIAAYRVQLNGELTLIGSFPSQITPNGIAITACSVGPEGKDLCHEEGHDEQRYLFVSLTGGHTYRFANATMLSDNGTVVGRADSGGDAAIFTRDSGVIMPRNVLELRGINAAGDIVGKTTSGLQFVSRRPYDSLIDLSSVFGWIFGSAVAINDRGDIIGTGNLPTVDGTGFALPFKFDMWFPGLDITSVTTINNARQVIGITSGLSNFQYFLFTPGRGTTLLPAAPIVLNNRGDILFQFGQR